ncbi:hypothetical protein PCYB_002020 [Plasmodium cynomolgi strain B]|uniref:Uncharacterized protein n=1 Tax=Plasmodium cynomolgi (strain B) TaxID=1120755 RepID=K6UNG0_PLACD|nr:hypothetical protein PCYB_002020 [Plasmodium cynomolgi strain B]GAB69453.1 hypothetical protein PCYB_002020 [Plasmodium cynomolgi strain B]
MEKSENVYGPLKPYKVVPCCSDDNDQIPFYFMKCKYKDDKDDSIYYGCSLVKVCYALKDTDKSVESGTCANNPNTEYSTKEKDTRTSPENEKENIRWKFGTRIIPYKSNKGGENVYDVIKYSDELHGDEISIRGENFGTYKLKDKEPATYKAFSEFIEKLTYKADDDRPDKTPEGITFLRRNNKNNVFYMLNNSYIRISVSCALGFGIFILLFLYFKFTPLGSYFRNRSSKEYKNMNSFLEEVPTESSPHKSNSGNANPQRKSAIVNYKKNSAGEKSQKNSSSENSQRKRLRIAYQPT